MELNPYESPTVATPDISREGQNTATDIAVLAVIGVVATAGTSLTFTLALAQALGQSHWDLSEPNFDFTYWFGAACGFPGAVAAGLSHQYSRRWLAAAAIGVLWPIVCGICFYLYVSSFMLG